jgi:hypothetical protein
MKIVSEERDIRKKVWSRKVAQSEVKLALSLDAVHSSNTDSAEVRAEEDTIW